MTAPIFDRVPPQNIEAERSVLGGILLNPEALCDVLDVLRGDPAEIFYVEAHQHLYAAILSLFRASKPVDSLMLMEALNAAGTLEAAGGISYIAGLTSAVPTSANVRYYAEIVTGAAILRKLISLCSKIAGFAYTPNMNANNLLVEAQEQILALSSEQTAGIRTIADGVEGAVDRILSLYKHGNTGGLMTGFSNLDTIIAGIEPEAVAVLAARPGMGKTALALNIATNVAKGGGNVLVFSLEMGRDSLEDRVVYSASQIEKRMVRQRLYNEQVLMSKLRQGVSQEHFGRIFVDDTAILTTMDIAARVRKTKHKHGLSLIVVDYLQLIQTTNPRASREAQVSEMSRALKVMAKHAGCPVFLLSQLNRGAEGVTEPGLSHLRESGAIEQDANIVVLLSKAEDNVIRVNIAKNRNGDTGVTALLFDKSTQTFRDYAGNINEPAQGYKRNTFDAPIEDAYDDGEDAF